MDLSFPRFDRDVEVTALPADLTVLMVGIAARQAASLTALTQAKAAGARAHARSPFILASFDARLLAPLDGAFNGPMAAALTRWQDE